MAEKIPAFLNYVRSISPSEALMFGISADGKKIPVEVVEKTVRGTISNYSAVYKEAGGTVDTKKIEKELDPENANIQRIDSAFLPHNADRLAVEYSLVIQGSSIAPAGCNSVFYREVLTNIAARYAELGGYNLLAERYLWNIINARALWRNRVAEDIQVSVETDGETYSFDAKAIDLHSFDSAVRDLPGFAVLSARIGTALSTKNGSLFLEVVMSGNLPSRAEVYPSQEFVDSSKQQKGKGSKSKTLSFLPVSTANDRTVRQATIHSQKIGNALRTIDEWHGKADVVGATAVEPFGFSQSVDQLFRGAKDDSSKDLYNILQRGEGILATLNKAKSIDEVPGEIHFLVAALIRGGVYSGGKKAA